MTHLLQDFRFAFQMMRKPLAMALLAALAFILGLGAKSRVAETLSFFTNLTGSAEVERLNLLLLSLITALAVGFVVAGIYGVMAYSVTQCTHEISLRMARGKSDVLKLVIVQGLKLALLGTVIGLSAAFLLARWIKVSLTGAETSDPLAFAGVAILLGFVAFFVYYLPAHREAKMEPIELRLK